MVSYTIDVELTERAAGVLILVIVDNGLVHIMKELIYVNPHKS